MTAPIPKTTVTPPPFPHPIAPQYDMNRLKELYSNTNKTNDALSLLFILPLTHPHLVNAAYCVCGGQRAATESGGRRWLGDFPVTLYLDTPHSQGCHPGNVHFGPLFIHHLILMFLQWPESAEMTLTRGAEPVKFRMTLAPTPAPRKYISAPARSEVSRWLWLQ